MANHKSNATLPEGTSEKGLTQSKDAPPPITYLGGNLGMSDVVTIHVHTPQGDTDITLQQALRHIDSFAEPGRSRLLRATSIHFGVEMAAA